MNLAESYEQHRLYSLAELLSLPDPENEWIVPYMIPLAGRTFAFGQGSTFKTEVMLDACIAVASGQQLLNQFPVAVKGGVLVNSTEGTIYGLKRRIVRHLRARPDVNPKDVRLTFCPEPYRIEDPIHFDALRRAIDEVQPLLLLLDPLDSFLEGNENSPTETRLFRRRADKLLRDYRELNLSLAIIHHSPVGTSERMRGTTAWRGWADAALQFTVIEREFGLKEPQKVLTVKSDKQREEKTGHLFTVVPLFDNQWGYTQYAVYDGQDHSGVAAAFLRQRVYGYLREHSPQAFSGRMLRDHFGVGHEKLQTALEQLEVSGLIQEGGRVSRAAGSGPRSRTVPGWYVTMAVSLVDAFMTLSSTEREEANRFIDRYELTPRDGGFGQLRAARVPTRP